MTSDEILAQLESALKQVDDMRGYYMSLEAAVGLWFRRYQAALAAERSIVEREAIAERLAESDAS